jgi:predicted transcriptional regulator
VTEKQTLMKKLKKNLTERRRFAVLISVMWSVGPTAVLIGLHGMGSTGLPWYVGSVD